MYRKHFAQHGLIDCRVGYCGGAVNSPDYRSVCSGTTGHAEAAQISFDPSKVSYTELVNFFFRMHDPTTKNRQGPDVGTQYRSAIFYHSEAQKLAAQEEMNRMQKTFYPHHKIMTEILPISHFWDAEKYHQLYLDKNPGGYECPSHFLRTKPMETL